MIKIDTEGLHPSTICCLEALQWLHEREAFSSILEIGCGNGILSAAAASIWGAEVLAADISPKAVDDTQAYIKQHGLEQAINVIRSDGFNHPDIVENTPYELIICNLLAELQLRFAKDARKHCKIDGYLLLSGILEWKKTEVEQVYTRLGFEIAHKTTSSPWVTMVFRHITAT
ncbi:MAG: 50S ribosomal protein L11 methyltransferase [Rickettsiales bacterium]